MFCEEEINKISDMRLMFTLVSVLYLPICFFLKSLKIKKNNKYDIHYTIWNLGLAIFSLCGFFYSINFTIALKLYNIKNIILNTSLLKSQLCSLGYYFLISKIIELGDTILILLRGRNLRFIQYYHHMITLLYCWYSHQYNQYNSSSELFCIMNLFIHSIMYSWYFLSSINIRTSNFVKNSISVLQTIQMFLGMGIIIVCIIYGNWLKLDILNSLFAIIMYGSYIVLFSKIVIKNLR